MKLTLVLLVSLFFSFPVYAKKKCLKDCQISDEGLGLIRNFEGYSPFIYDDAAGFPTIGYGHLIRKGETFPVPFMPDAANKLLRSDAMVAEKGVKRQVKILVWPWQYDALTSFTFNLGEGALAGSTLLRFVNASRHKEVPPQFLRWNKAGGKVLMGLVIRREMEAMLYDSEGVRE